MSHTPEFPSGTYKDMAVVTVLAERFAAVGKATRAAMDDADELHDQDTVDLFTQVSARPRPVAVLPGVAHSGMTSGSRLFGNHLNP